MTSGFLIYFPGLNDPIPSSNLVLLDLARLNRESPEEAAAIADASGKATDAEILRHRQATNDNNEPGDAA